MDPSQLSGGEYGLIGVVLAMLGAFGWKVMDIFKALLLQRNSPEKESPKEEKPKPSGTQTLRYESTTKTLERLEAAIEKNSSSIETNAEKDDQRAAEVSNLKIEFARLQGNLDKTKGK